MEKLVIGLLRELEEIQEKEIELYINPIVVTEFFTDNTLLIDKNLQLALKLFESFRSLDITKPIGLLGGRTNENKRSSRERSGTSHRKTRVKEERDQMWLISLMLMLKPLMNG